METLYEFRRFNHLSIHDLTGVYRMHVGVGERLPLLVEPEDRFFLKHSIVCLNRGRVHIDNRGIPVAFYQWYEVKVDCKALTLGHIALARDTSEFGIGMLSGVYPRDGQYMWFQNETDAVAFSIAHQEFSS